MGDGTWRDDGGWQTECVHVVSGIVGGHDGNVVEAITVEIATCDGGASAEVRSTPRVVAL
jgi:hypothetical protein